MADIKKQSLIYHLTSLHNVPSILDQGLLPRSELARFTDVADGDILSSREGLNLQNYVPFHFFARNPFDGRVQADHPEHEFVLFTVHRSLAKGNDWSIIPCHPLASQRIELLGYESGFDAIDWDAMNKRDYHDPHSKSVCMAECLSPGSVDSGLFHTLFVRTHAVKAEVERTASESGVSLDITVNANMFLRTQH